MQGSFNKAFQLGGFAFSNGATAAVTFDSTVIVEVSVPAGNVLTNWVKTDNDTASGDLAGGHGRTSGTYDVFWTESGVKKARYGVTNTITTNACALDGGAGDNFPATAHSGVVITKQVVALANIDGDNTKLFGVFFSCTDTAAPASCDLQDVGNGSIEQFDLVESTVSGGLNHAYATTEAVALLTGNVIYHAKCTNGSSTAAGTIYILAGVDSTP